MYDSINGKRRLCFKVVWSIVTVDGCSFSTCRLACYDRACGSWNSRLEIVPFNIYVSEEIAVHSRSAVVNRKARSGTVKVLC